MIVVSIHRFMRRKQAPPSAFKNFMSAMPTMPTITMPKLTSSGSESSTPKAAATAGGDNSSTLSEEEKRARREVLSKAANERTQTWDKKLSANKSNKIKKVS